MPALAISHTLPGCPLYRVPWEPLAHAFLGSRHPTRRLPILSILGYSRLLLPQLQLSRPSLFFVENPRTFQYACTSALPVLPGYPLCQEPYNCPRLCPLQLQLSCRGDSCSEPPEIPSLCPTLPPVTCKDIICVESPRISRLYLLQLQQSFLIPSAHRALKTPSLYLLWLSCQDIFCMESHRIALDDTTSPLAISPGQLQVRVSYTHATHNSSQPEKVTMHTQPSQGIIIHCFKFRRSYFST